MAKVDWDKIVAADIVYACLPDGQALLVKGRSKLKEIIETKKAQECEALYVEVEDLDEAYELRQRVDDMN